MGKVVRGRERGRGREGEGDGRGRERGREGGREGGKEGGREGGRKEWRTGQSENIWGDGEREGESHRVGETDEDEDAETNSFRKAQERSHLRAQTGAAAPVQARFSFCTDRHAHSRARTRKHTLAHARDLHIKVHSSRVAGVAGGGVRREGGGREGEGGRERGRGGGGEVERGAGGRQGKGGWGGRVIQKDFPLEFAGYVPREKFCRSCHTK